MSHPMHKSVLNIVSAEQSRRYFGQDYPPRFAARLPEFVVKFLTKPGDLVVDIFAGSNTTGFVCENLGRKWLAFEMSHEYLAASVFRFHALLNNPETFYAELVQNSESNILLKP